MAEDEKQDDIDQQLSDLMGEIYKQLAESQEPLGEEFARVLHENLWDLYER